MANNLDRNYNITKFMRKNFTFFLLLTSIFGYSQDNGTVQFEFYKNGKSIDLKNVRVKLVQNVDTVACQIIGRRISVPKLNGEYSVILTFKKESYVVDNVDFSKIRFDCKFTFGTEKNIKNFKPLLLEVPNIYGLERTMIFVKIENIDIAKKINFVTFTTLFMKDKKSDTLEAYSQYNLISK